MRWSFVVPGQPVSWDQAYRMGLVTVNRGGKLTIDPRTRMPRTIHRPVKTDEAQRWQDTVQLLAQNAKPSRWKPDGQLRVEIELHLTHAMDADNSLKLILDALAKGIGYNDRYFLPCVRSMEDGLPLRDARVVLTIDDDTAHYH